MVIPGSVHGLCLHDPGYPFWVAVLKPVISENCRRYPDTVPRIRMAENFKLESTESFLDYIDSEYARGNAK